MNGMPPVSRCAVTNCFYNTNNACHAPAINVGSDHPVCDTFIAEPMHIGRQDTGMVGACHMADCRFNADMTCTAKGIEVSGHADHADCVTFAQR